MTRSAVYCCCKASIAAAALAVYALLAGKVLDEHVLLCLNANGPAKALVGIHLVAGCKATCGHGHAKYDMMEFHCVCFC